jgi:hypothetical protein
VWTAEDQEAGIMPEIKAVFIAGASKGNVNTYSGTINFETMTFEGRLACVEGNFAGARVKSGERRAGQRVGRRAERAEREAQKEDMGRRTGRRARTGERKMRESHPTRPTR